MNNLLTIEDKAAIILKHINDASLQLGENVEDMNIRAISTALEEIEERQPTRTLEEVQNIVDAVRVGMDVQVDYASEDDDEFVHKACW